MRAALEALLDGDFLRDAAVLGLPSDPTNCEKDE
jgi:hypothetical protein